jgi:hypothetical protein
MSRRPLTEPQPPYQLNTSRTLVESPRPPDQADRLRSRCGPMSSRPPPWVHARSVSGRVTWQPCGKRVRDPRRSQGFHQCWPRREPRWPASAHTILSSSRPLHAQGQCQEACKPDKANHRRVAFSNTRSPCRFGAGPANDGRRYPAPSASGGFALSPHDAVSRLSGERARKIPW